MPVRRRKPVAGREAASPGPSVPHGSGRAAKERGRSVPRYLTASGGPTSAVPVIQRQETGGGPAGSSSFQLTPPSLLQPPDPYARYIPRGDYQLRLDPEVQMMAARMRAQALLDPDFVLAGVRPLAPVVPASPAGAPTPPVVATPPGPGPGPAPAPGSPASQGATSAAPGGRGTPAGGSPPGGIPSPEPSRSRPGGAGDVLSAVMALPQVRGLLLDVRTQFTGDFSRYWEGASTGERAGFVGASVVVGGAILAPVLGFEGPRDFVLPRLNGVVLPVPGVSGLGLEFNFGERSVMVGAHLDVGVLLPSVWGFGPASFNPIGGPPGSAAGPGPPSLSPKEEEGPRAGLPGDLADRLGAARGAGAPLPDALLDRFEARGTDASGVRVHTGAAADRLARDTGSRAFASGRDLFFRSGAYDPASSAGVRLLAHEVAHVGQQARGELPPVRPDLPVRMGVAGDALERDADRVAEGLAGADGAGERAGAGTPPP